MSNARLGRKHCVYCCEPATKVGPLSWRGSCSDCSNEAMVSASIQLATKSGPVYERAVRGRRDQAIREAARLDTPAAA